MDGLMCVCSKRFFCTAGAKKRRGERDGRRRRRRIIFLPSPPLLLLLLPPPPLLLLLFPSLWMCSKRCGWIQREVVANVVAVATVIVLSLSVV